MIARLGHTPGQTTAFDTPKTSVDIAARRRRGNDDRHAVATSPRQRAIWLRPEPAVSALASAPYLGSRERKRALWADVSRCAIERGDELAASFNVDQRLRETPPLSPVERIAVSAAEREREFAELDAEELSPRSLASHLPDELVAFLDAMPPARRREREDAIVDQVGWAGIKLIGIAPFMLVEIAEVRAARYAMEFPRFDPNGNPINQHPDHNRGRCAKIWRRRLKDEQNKALLYVEAALSAVGGEDAPGRPLYASDYSVERQQEHVQRTEEALKKLLLVRVDDPSVRIPMMDVNERAKAADAAKRRLLIDVNLARWRVLGWFVCWITITLPGEYVPHATNEGRRVSEWNPALGPAEAMAAIQADHHRVLACLRDAGVRPSGWWNAQPQQSGAPHRHYVVACRTVEDARAVCDGFRAKFSSRADGDDVQERGCRAYVLGDHHPGYRAPKGRNGKHETAESVARYAARYATRYEARKKYAPTADVGSEGDDIADIDRDDMEHGDRLAETGRVGPIGPDDDESHEKDAVENIADKPASDAERFTTWKRLRRARTHTWLGLDSRRAPSELWDTLWANSCRMDVQAAEAVADPRMRLAMRHMRLSRHHADEAVFARMDADSYILDTKEDIAARAKALDKARAEADQSGVEAWHAAIALGMWSDTDLDPAEREWLAGAIKELDPLPPEPLRVTTETIYGDTRKIIKGAVGAVERARVHGEVRHRSLIEIVDSLGIDLDGLRLKPSRLRKALSKAGIRNAKRPDGSTVFYSLTGTELRISEHDWKIVDHETAEEMLTDAFVRIYEERKRVAEERDRKAVGLSLSPTDPSNGPAGPPHGDGEGKVPPPEVPEP